MKENNKTELLDQIRNSPDGICIPNDPKITGISGEQDFVSLSKKEMKTLKKFLNLVKESEVIVKNLAKNGIFEEIYRLNGTFFKISTQWNETSKRTDICVGAIDFYDAKKQLEWTIKILSHGGIFLPHNTPYRKYKLIEQTGTPISVKDRINELNVIIYDRILRTSCGDMYKMDPMERHSKIWAKIDGYFRANGKYPSNEEVFDLEGMHHPLVKSFFDELSLDLQKINYEITVIEPHHRDEKNEEDIAMYEAVKEICHTSEKLTQENLQLNAYRKGCVYFEIETIYQPDVYDRDKIITFHILKVISESDLDTMLQWDEEDYQNLRSGIVYKNKLDKEVLEFSKSVLERLIH